MRLIDIRKDKNIRAADLAAKIGISQGYYSNLESGKRPFSGFLLRKIAKVLDVRLNTLQEAIKSRPADSYKLKSWMSNIRIHGLPLIKAFHYYLETNGMNVQALDDARLKAEMRKFVEANIGFSILAELSENKSLLSHIRESIGAYAMVMKNDISIIKSKT